MGNSIEYFVSFCVMTNGGNPFGHSFLLLSQLNTNKPSADVEIVEAVGFYSRYLPILGYKPISPGRVKQEEPEYIARQEGLFHKTFQINESELAMLLTEINADRRIGVQDIPSPGKPLQSAKPGGPLFNLFKGKNCTNYALKKLERLGLPVADIHSRFEIPRFSKSGLNPLRLSSYYSLVRKKEIYYWDDLLFVTPRDSHEHKKREAVNQAFFALQEGMKEMVHLLEKRDTDLQMQGQKIKPVVLALKKIKALQKEINSIQSQPNRINQQVIANTFAQLQSIVSTYSATCPSRGQDPLVISLFNCIKMVYYKLKTILWGMPLRKEHPCGQEETRLFQQLDGITKRHSFSPG